MDDPNQALREIRTKTRLSGPQFAAEIVLELKRQGIDVSQATVLAWLRPATNKAHRKAPRIAARVASGRWRLNQD